MNPLNRLEWRQFHIALSLLLFSLLLSVGLWFGAREFKQNTRLAHTQTEAEHKEANALYEDVKKAINIIEQAYPQFLTLQKQGFLGESQRLDWMNQLYLLQEKLRLPSIEYDISPQRPYQIPGLMEDKQFHIFVSEMKLTLGILHSGDLFSALDELKRQQAAGIFHVSDCVLAPVRQISADRLQAQSINPEQAALKAVCTLQRYTVKIEE